MLKQLQVFVSKTWALLPLLKLTLLHPERPKFAYNFGLSECNRVKVHQYTFWGSNSAILISGSLPGFGLPLATFAKCENKICLAQKY